MHALVTVPVLGITECSNMGVYVCNQDGFIFYLTQLKWMKNNPNNDDFLSFIVHIQMSIMHFTIKSIQGYAVFHITHEEYNHMAAGDSTQIEIYSHAGSSYRRLVRFQITEMYFIRGVASN